MQNQADFQWVDQQIQTYYRNQEYEAALELAKESLPLFPDQVSSLYYWQVCLAARMGKNSQVYAILDEMHGQGLWFSDYLFRKSPSLQKLQGEPQFEKRIADSSALMEKEKSLLPPLLVAKPEKLEPPFPLIMALHENTSTNLIAMKSWQPAARLGWMLAAPQSTLAHWNQAYGWVDADSARPEISRHFETLQKKYIIDNRRLLLAGSSMGGGIAIELALTGPVKVNGFIAVNPYLPDIEEWPVWKYPESIPHIKGFVIYGENDDTIPHEGLHALLALMRSHGSECYLEAQVGLGHEFPQDFEDTLKRAFQFLYGD